ncbi:MDR family MFS transporter [Staphylococcus kloosii]|uniref:Quinolone resistance protein NorB n=1 Tax=Staphylococcus kloosii TaxID=29384 RepID=A0A151A371_9STAP|nr:MDR family MFS transporter [Staphylococcus kloosii]KYH13829.1 multidrug MFS transporter [Staphylococcus kloosii]
MEDLNQRNKTLLIAILMVGSFVAILNQTLMTTALPSIMKQMDLSSSTVQWLTSIFMLVNGIMIPITAFLTQRFTTRTLYFAALTFFIVGSLICVATDQFGVILAGRAVQAMGAGIMMPLMQTVLFLVYPSDKRGQAMGMFGLVVGFAPAIGPTLSGWVVSQYSWKVIFYILLIVAIVDLLFAIKFVKNVTDVTKPKLDKTSVTLSTLGFAALLFGFSEAGNLGWTHPLIYSMIIVGILILTLFVLKQLRMEKPFLNVRVFTYKSFTMNMILVCIVFISFIGSQTVLSFYLQDLHGYSPLKSGLALMPGGIITGILSPVTGRIFDKYGGKLLSIVGVSIVVITSFAFTQLNAHTSFAYVTTFFAISLAANAMVFNPLTTAALNNLSRDLVPHGTSMNNTMRQVGAAMGSAMLVTVMNTAILNPHKYGIDGLVHGVRVAYIVICVIAVIGLILAIFNPTSKKGYSES